MTHVGYCRDAWRRLVSSYGLQARIELSVVCCVRFSPVVRLFGGFRGCVCPARLIQGSGASRHVCRPCACTNAHILHQAPGEVASGLFAIRECLVWPNCPGMRLLCLALPLDAPQLQPTTLDVSAEAHAAARTCHFHAYTFHSNPPCGCMCPVSVVYAAHLL
jgi:hypothetical protein